MNETLSNGNTREWNFIYDSSGKLIAAYYIEKDSSGRIVGYKIQRKIVRGEGLSQTITWTTKSMSWQYGTGSQSDKLIKMTKEYTEVVKSYTDVNKVGGTDLSKWQVNWTYSNYKKTTDMTWDSAGNMATYKVTEQGESFKDVWEKAKNASGADEWVHKVEGSTFTKTREMTFTGGKIQSYISTSQSNGKVDWQAYTINSDGSRGNTVSGKNTKHQTPWSRMEIKVTYTPDGTPIEMTVKMRAQIYDDNHPSGFIMERYTHSTWSGDATTGKWNTPDLNTSTENYSIVSPVENDSQGHLKGTWYFYNSEAKEDKDKWGNAAPAEYHNHFDSLNFSSNSTPNFTPTGLNATGTGSGLTAAITSQSFTGAPEPTVTGTQTQTSSTPGPSQTAAYLAEGRAPPVSSLQQSATAAAISESDLKNTYST
ncbi:MAG: hypothetical protein AAB267_02160, partial [Candidatus Desantisbacteria bacterium]